MAGTVENKKLEEYKKRTKLLALVIRQAAHRPITLWMWMSSTVLHLLVYSLTVAFCITMDFLTMPVGFNFDLTLNPQVGGIKIVTV